MIKLIAEGNLGADAQTKYLDNGFVAVSFSMAITERGKDKEGNRTSSTTWLHCTYWRKNDQLKIVEYLLKGTKVLIFGKPAVRQWQSGDKTGVSFDCRVDEIHLLGSEKNQQQQNVAPAAATTAAVPQNTPLPGEENNNTNPFANSTAPDDLPF